MKLYAPKYYKDFTCIAEKCKHSCCIGWEIDIDAETVKRYRSLDHGYGREIKKSVDMDGSPHFRLCDRDRCPHLDENGLCRIILELGEGYLCDICREHPRFYNDTLHGREVGIGMACEEAARIVLCSENYADIVEIGEIDGTNAEEFGIDGEGIGTNAEEFGTDGEEFGTDGEGIGTDGDAETGDGGFDATAEREKLYAILSDKARTYRERLDRISREYSVSPDILDNDGWREIFSSLEYLDDAHREDFNVFSLSPQVEGRVEVYLERTLAYFIYRHCTEAADAADFRASLGLCLVLERLLASLAEKLGAKDAADLIIPARIISEELEYSEENTEIIKLEFEFG